MEVLGVDDSPARFALVREVPPLCSATPGAATSTPAVIIDLPPVRHQAGPGRLLDVAPGRSRKVLRTWFAARGESWPGRVEVVAPGWFHRAQERRRRGAAQGPGGHGPLRVVSIAGDKLDQFRHRPQRQTTSRRGRAGDRHHQARRTLRTDADLLADAQAERLEALFVDERYAPVTAAWGVYQRPVPGLPGRGPGTGAVPDATAHRLPGTDCPRRAGGDRDPG